MQQDVAALSTLASTLWVFVGIVISLALPIAVKTLRKTKLEGTENPSYRQRVAAAWTKYGGNRYLGIALAATLVAVVLVFLMGLKFFTSRDAVLAGFAWESLINKLLGGGPTS